MSSVCEHVCVRARVCGAAHVSVEPDLGSGGVGVSRGRRGRLPGVRPPFRPKRNTQFSSSVPGLVSPRSRSQCVSKPCLDSSFGS